MQARDQQLSKLARKQALCYYHHWVCLYLAAMAHVAPDHTRVMPAIAQRRCFPPPHALIGIPENVNMTMKTGPELAGESCHGFVSCFVTAAVPAKT